MSKMSELAYDIEQLWIDGHSPKVIALMMECPLEIVYEWLEDNSIQDEDITPEEWDEAFPAVDNFDPYDTVNS